MKLEDVSPGMILYASAGANDVVVYFITQKNREVVVFDQYLVFEKRQSVTVQHSTSDPTYKWEEEKDYLPARSKRLNSADHFLQRMVIKKLLTAKLEEWR
jgi:hypothetical protein